MFFLSLKDETVGASGASYLHTLEHSQLILLIPVTILYMSGCGACHTLIKLGLMMAMLCFVYL